MCDVSSVRDEMGEKCVWIVCEDIKCEGVSKKVL